MKKLILILFVIVYSIVFGYDYIYSQLNLNGIIKSKKVIDLNNDNKKELIVITSNSSGTRFTLYIYSLVNRKYVLSASMPLNKVYVYDINDINRDGIKDYIYIYKKNIYVKFITKAKAGFEFSKNKLLLKTDSIYSIPNSGTILYIDFADDYNSDGYIDIILPVNNGALMYEGINDGNFKKIGILRTDTTAFIPPQQQRKISLLKDNSLWYTIIIPQKIFEDYNGDGMKDIIFICANSIFIYMVNKNKVNRTPIVLSLDTGDNDEQYMNNSGVPPLKSVVNYNNDKYLDFVVQKMNFSMEGKGVKTSLMIFNGRDKSVSRLKPDCQITANGMFAFFPPFLRDYNGDGKKDIMTLYFPFSITRAITTILTKSSSGKLIIYKNNGDCTFKKDKIIRSLSAEMKFEPPFLLSFVDFYGDFNNDGIRDLVFGNLDDNEFSIYAGSKDGTYSSDSFIKAEGKLYLNSVVDNIDDNDRSDIIMFQYEKGKVSLFLF